jgi:orotidine-5'-phosphate decarboxylase
MNGKTQNGTGMIINSSRGIIYTSHGEDFAEAARNATERLRDEINRYR